MLSGVVWCDVNKVRSRCGASAAVSRTKRALLSQMVISRQIEHDTVQYSAAQYSTVQYRIEQMRERKGLGGGERVKWSAAAAQT
jgi:hypothetical protein